MARDGARRATVAWIALVLAIAGASLIGVLDNGFVGDDGPFIVGNESLGGSGALRRIVTAGDAFGTGCGNPYYRPATTLSFAIDRWLFGESPVGYHATSLLLHLAVCALVFLAALKQTGRRFAAGAAALLFAVHPANVEPVAYISARADLLCGGFMIGAWLLYVRGRERGSTRLVALAVIAFSVALLSKIVALALLPVLALREVALARRGERRLGPLLPFGAVAAAFMLARALVLERTTWGSPVSLGTRLATSGPLLLEYLGTTLLPVDLKVFYDVPLRANWADPAVLGAWAVLALCAWAWVLLLRRRPWIAIGIAWYFAALVPAAGIVDLLYPALMADRYLYVPLAGAAFVLAGALPVPGTWRCWRLQPRRAMALAWCAPLMAFIPAFATLSARQVPVWHDSVTLWEEGRRGAPASPYVLNALGWAYWQVDRLDDAQRVLETAAAIAPRFTDPKVNLAAVALLRGDAGAAARYTEQVLQIDPADAVALRYRGVLLAQYGRTDLAIDSLRAAVAADPFDEHSRRYLSELEAARANRL